jgi:hypothetical protein
MTAATFPPGRHTSHPGIRPDASPPPEETSPAHPRLAPPRGGAPRITRISPSNYLRVHNCRVKLAIGHLQLSQGRGAPDGAFDRRPVEALPLDGRRRGPRGRQSFGPGLGVAWPHRWQSLGDERMR